MLYATAVEMLATLPASCKKSLWICDTPIGILILVLFNCSVSSAWFIPVHLVIEWL